MRLSVSLFSLLAGIFVSSQAAAQVPLFDEPGRTYKKSAFELSFQTTYYEANANYTKTGGEYVSLIDGYGYNLLSFDFGFRWVPVNNWGVYASTQVANASSDDLRNTRQNSSFTHALLGTDFVLASWKRFEIVPDFSLIIPYERIDATEDYVLNHEGAVEGTARVMATAKFGSFKPFGFVGFTYRDEGRSSLMPYGAGMELEFATWSLVGEVRGYQTVVKDKYTSEPLRREVVAPKNGGALRFFAIDPSLLEANGWIRKNFGGLGIKLGGGASITGANTAAGWNVIAGLSYQFGTAKTPKSIHHPPPKEEATQFREETEDGVDQSLFQPPPPPPPQADPAERQKIQNEQNQGDFQIELKRTKPTKKKRRPQAVEEGEKVEMEPIPGSNADQPAVAPSVAPSVAPTDAQ